MMKVKRIQDIFIYLEDLQGNIQDSLKSLDFMEKFQ